MKILRRKQLFWTQENSYFIFSALQSSQNMIPRLTTLQNFRNVILCFAIDIGTMLVNNIHVFG